MKPLGEIIRKLIELRAAGTPMTLLAVCPNSEAVLEAAVKAAAANNAPMLFAATLNQVDRDGGYTGWTPAEFVLMLQRTAQKYKWEGPLYPCLDHGGPWLKDIHTTAGYAFEQTFSEVKQSMLACLKAGYKLLHIDPTVDRTLPPDKPLPIELVVQRTVELIGHVEAERQRLGLPEIAYEVGSEEVHGGLVELERFKDFLAQLRAGLAARNLAKAWPCFIVAQVGTDLHTTHFDATAAARLFELVAPYDSLIKGHYSDWVENPAEYPASGMGGANVGPEFTAEEYLALHDMDARERQLCRDRRDLHASDFMGVLEQAVVDSGRWKKWLQPDERGLDFTVLSPERRSWLAQTGARYIWTAPAVKEARQRLYCNLGEIMPDPGEYVVDRIAAAIEKYIKAFNLVDSNKVLS